MKKILTLLTVVTMISCTKETNKPEPTPIEIEIYGVADNGDTSILVHQFLR